MYNFFFSPWLSFFSSFFFFLSSTSFFNNENNCILYVLKGIRVVYLQSYCKYTVHPLPRIVYSCISLSPSAKQYFVHTFFLTRPTIWFENLHERRSSTTLPSAILYKVIIWRAKKNFFSFCMKSVKIRRRWHESYRATVLFVKGGENIIRQYDSRATTHRNFLQSGG